jgi:hypothetical protein
MRRIFIATTAAFIIVSPAHAQLVGPPSGQGGTPPAAPNVSTAPPPILNTPGASQSQDPALQLEGSSTEIQGPTSTLTPSPRVRALNQLTTRPPPLTGGRGQAERPAGPLR